MEQPKKGTVRKNSNVPRVSLSVEQKPVEDESDDSDEQLRVVNLLCYAVDLIVESRSTAVAAIRDAHTASLTSELQLLVSHFPEHIRKMPMKKFLKQHCPNTVAITRPDGTLRFDLVLDLIGILRYTSFRMCVTEAN